MRTAKIVATAAYLVALGACQGCHGPKTGQGSAVGPPTVVPPTAGPSDGHDLGPVAKTLPNPDRKLYYIRPKGGTPSQCTGLVDADYPGSGSGEACALKHPFYLLRPGSTKPLLKGGDTVVIGRGSYPMGVGAPGASASVCATTNAWDCYMPPVPSGTAAAPTRILGQGYNGGCKQPPQLYGVQRTRQIFDLTGSSHVRVECLELTDHDQCVVHHKGSIACKRDKYPYGDWADSGILAADSADVTLRNLNIHGFAHTGIAAGRLADWTLERVRIAGNGWVGWDGDTSEPAGSSNKGRIIFREVTIEYNGCGETYPGGKPVGCWGQTAGGYGDGMGTAATGGDWLFEDCRFLHNTSDGLDLLYHSLGGTITIRRTLAEGNAGNPIKVCGNATIENSVLVGNCDYFKGKPFTHHVDHCRARGNTLELTMVTGSKATLVNSTLYGVGDVLVNMGARTGHPCNGTESVVALNNIFLGGQDFHQPFDRSALY